MGREWYLNWGTKSSSKKGNKASGGGGGGRGGGERRVGERKVSTPPMATAAAAAATAGGCMNAVLHMFDFQHFQLCLHPQDTSFLPDDPTPLKGLEAPRNSLESITEEDKDDHSRIITKDGIQIITNRRDTALKLVQAPRGKVEDLSSSESGCSPAGARTPNVVARLMGLEILPESNNTTPRSSHSQISPHIRTSSNTPISSATKTSKKASIPGNHRDVPGTRSTPETPRNSTTSTRRRRSTDVAVDHHRLSLQINKENSIQKEMELSRPSCSAINTKRRDGKHSCCYEEEVTKSPSYYARQIMKQVRETVSRRVGVDITNTIGNGERGEHRRDEHLLSSSKTSALSSSKPKKSSKKDHQLSPLSSSSSPKIRSHYDENNISSNSNSNNKKTTTVCSKPDQNTAPAATGVALKTVTLQEKLVEKEKDESLMKFTTTSSSKPNLTNKKQSKSCDSMKNKKDEQFVRPSSTTASKKCKKTMLSSDSVPSLVSFKKDSLSSVTPPTKLLDKQGVSSITQPSKPILTTTTISTTTSTTTTRLSRYPRQRITEEAIHASTDRWRTRKDVVTTAVPSAMEFQYISRILKCTGIDRDTPVSFMRWYLPSHPLNPSFFYTLEQTYYHPTQSISDSSCDHFNLVVNRKLIFHLVDEMLVEILKPYVKLKHHYHLRHHHRCHNHFDEQNQQINGYQLVKILCSKIRSFPSADCQTLQDIDALVERDLPGFGAASNLIAFQEESEKIVSEIECDIMDSLVQDLISIS